MKNSITDKGYQRNKYLEDLGLSITEYGTNFCDKSDKRWKKWKKERKKYGFDARECWNMDQIFVEWLYSHFMKYKEDCDSFIDLKCHKFLYQKEKDTDPIEITQSEAIDIICDACKKYLLSEQYSIHVDCSIFKPEIMTLLGEIMPAMWW